MDLARDEFITSMLRIHQANSSRKWHLMIKNAKMEKFDLTLSTYVQYVEDFNSSLMSQQGLIDFLKKKSLNVSKQMLTKMDLAS